MHPAMGTMPETQTYIFQPEHHPAHTYEIEPEGLIYRPPGRESVAVRWEQIRYLEDVVGRKVDVVTGDSAITIPLFYATRDFASLLTAVCARLVDLHREKIGVRTFKGHTSYLVQIGTVLAFFAMMAVVGAVHLQRHTMVSLFLLATTLPMTVYLLRRPHTVTPNDTYLEVRDFTGTRRVDYARIRTLAFDLHGDKHISYLCLKIHLTDGRKLKMQRLENLVLLYIFIKTRWDAARAHT